MCICENKSGKISSANHYTFPYNFYKITDFYKKCKVLVAMKLTFGRVSEHAFGKNNCASSCCYKIETHNKSCIVFS